MRGYWWALAGGIFVGALMGAFMGNQAIGAGQRNITGSFAAPFQAKMDTGR